MVRTQQGAPSNEWLAVLDGRFLPIDELEISIERDTQDITSATSMSPSTTVTTAEIIEGSIQTRREPALKARPVQLRLCGPDEEYLLWNLSVEGGVGIGLGEAYIVEFAATQWECRKQ